MNQNPAPKDTCHVDPASTNANLITDIVSSLQELEEGDTELTKILVENLLTNSPAPDAVQKASDAITQLAAERAKGVQD